MILKNIVLIFVQLLTWSVFLQSQMYSSTDLKSLSCFADSIYIYLWKAT